MNDKGLGKDLASAKGSGMSQEQDSVGASGDPVGAGGTCRRAYVVRSWTNAELKRSYVCYTPLKTAFRYFFGLERTGRHRKALDIVVSISYDGATKK